MLLAYISSQTVTQSSYDEPCTQLWLDDDQRPGLDSGYPPVNPDGEIPIFPVTITSNDTMAFFCQIKGHCNQDGMVMLVNPPNDGRMTFDAFQKKANASLAPGYGHFSNFSRTAALNCSKSAFTIKLCGGAHNPRVLSGPLAVATLLVFALLL